MRFFRSCLILWTFFILYSQSFCINSFLLCRKMAHKSHHNRLLKTAVLRTGSSNKNQGEHDEESFQKISPSLTTTTSTTPSSSVLFEMDQRFLGILVLLTVPISWGTYAPAVKYVYQLQPPVPGLLFSAAYYTVASLSLLCLNFVSAQRDPIISINENFDHDERNNNQLPTDNNAVLPAHVLGGLELGSYLVIGNALQVTGLQSVPVDRAAFLVQLTTIIVPILQAIFAGSLASIPTRTWIACFIAFAGVVTMELDGMTLIQSSTSVFDDFSSITPLTAERGDLYIILAAVAYSFHVLRLQKYAAKVKPLTLAASKATVEAILSIFFVLVLFFINDSTNAISSNAASNDIVDFYYAAISGSNLFSSDQTVQLVGAVLWTGIVTCAYTIYAQSFGQQRVSPTDAALIYSCQPIFSSIFAFFLLDETLGSLGFIGGTLVASAVYIAASSSSVDRKSSSNI